MELSEKTKIHVYGIFMILMSVSFLFIDNYSDKTLQIIGVTFFTSSYIMLLFLNSRRYKIFYIKRFCPNIYDTYFKYLPFNLDKNSCFIIAAGSREKQEDEDCIWMRQV